MNNVLIFVNGYSIINFINLSIYNYIIIIIYIIYQYFLNG